MANQDIIFNNTTVFETWQDFITGSLKRNLPIQVAQTDSQYSVFAFDGLITYACYIYKFGIGAGPGYSQAQNDADRTDFEQNYLSQSNSKINSDPNAFVVQMPQYARTNFGQMRAVQPFTLFDIVNKYGIDSYEFGSASIGGGSIASILSQSVVALSVGTGSTDSMSIRSNTFFRYQAGKEQVIKLTGYNSNKGVANQVRRWGYFDDQNGVFFCVSGSAVNIVSRTSAFGGNPVDTIVTQSAWNIDTFDGKGISRTNVDVTKSNIYEFHIDWLGVGYVDCYINGLHVHRFDNANTFHGPYMTTAVLPISIEIQNAGVSTASTFNFICTCVESDGGNTFPKYSFGAYNSSDTVVGTSEIPLIAIRPGTSFKGITNRTLTLPSRLSVSTEGGRAGFRVILNPTSITSGTWISASLNSSVEYLSGATAFVDNFPGQTLYRGFLPNANDSREVDLSSFFSFQGSKLRLNAYGTTADTLLVVGICEQPGTTLMRSSLVWDEIK